METHEERANRYERFLRALADERNKNKWCEALLHLDVIEWANETARELLYGNEAECPICSTAIHDGECVSEDG